MISLRLFPTQTAAPSPLHRFDSNCRCRIISLEKTVIVDEGKESSTCPEYASGDEGTSLYGTIPTPK